MDILWTYQDHALRAETTGFILYDLCMIGAPSGGERGRRESRGVAGWLARLGWLMVIPVIR